MVLLAFRNCIRLAIRHISSHFVQYLFSHIGLLGLVVVYCVGGAYLFALIETPGVLTDIRTTVNVSRDLEDQRRYVIEVLTNSKCSDDFNETVKNMLEEYQRMIADAIQNYNYIGTLQEEDDIVNGWVFPSSLLFTVTILTTVGYGHVTPKSPVGQVIVIPYSLLGIPLMLLFLVDIGNFMARCFRLGYARCCCFVCWRRRKKNYNSDSGRRNTMKAIPQAKGDIEIAHRAVGQSEEGLKARGEHGTGPLGRDSTQGTADQKVGNGTARQKTPDRPQTPPSSSKDLEDGIRHRPLDEEFLQVPISLTVVLAVLYLFISAILFAAWNDWTWVQGIYFSFVTLATIGFGDFIPGWREASTAIGKVKLGVTCLYIVFGLAVLSMSFNLMLDKMLPKVKWIGRQIGVVKRPTDHGEGTNEQGQTPPGEARKAVNLQNGGHPPEGRTTIVIQDIEQDDEIRKEAPL